VQMMAIDRPVINDLKREIQKKNISDHYHNWLLLIITNY
jgi:hypothetical protein